MTAAAVRAGRAFVELSILDKTHAEMMKVQGRIRNIGSAISSVAMPLAATGAGMLGMLSAPLMLASNLEQSTTKFETLLGSAEKAVSMMEMLRGMAAKTPFETTDLVAATEQLLNFGVAGEDIEKAMQMLGDASGGNAERFKHLAFVYGQMRNTGRLMGDDWRQMVGQGFNPLNEISKKTGESMSELKKRMEAGGISADEVTAAFASATGAGGRFNGMMEKQSQTLAGRWSTLKDEIGMALVPIGEAVRPIASALMWVATKLVSVFGWFNTHFKFVYTLIAAAGVAMIALASPFIVLGAAVSALAAAFGLLLSSLPMIGMGLMLFNNLGTASALLGLAFRFVRSPMAMLLPMFTSVNGAGRSLLSVFSMLPSPIGTAFRAVRGLGLAGWGLASSWGLFAGIGTRVAAVLTRIGPMAAMLSRFFGPLTQLALSAVSLFPGPIGLIAAVLGKMGFAVNTASGAYAIFGGRFGSLLKLFLRFGPAVQMLGGILATLTGPVGLVVAAVGGLIYYFRDDLMKAIGEVGKFFGAIFDQIYSAIATLVTSLRDLGEYFGILDPEAAPVDPVTAAAEARAKEAKDQTTEADWTSGSLLKKTPAVGEKKIDVQGTFSAIAASAMYGFGGKKDDAQERQIDLQQDHLEVAKQANRKLDEMKRMLAVS